MFQVHPFHHLLQRQLVFSYCHDKILNFLRSLGNKRPMVEQFGNLFGACSVLVRLLAFSIPQARL